MSRADDRLPPATAKYVKNAKKGGKFDYSTPGFVFALWKLLQSTDAIPRQMRYQCGWLSPGLIYLNISTLSGHLTSSPVATRHLLREHGFLPAGQDQWRCPPQFHRAAQEADIMALDSAWRPLRPFFLASLEPFRIFAMPPADVQRFQVRGITLWSDIVQANVWAVSTDEFFAKATARFSESCMSEPSKLRKSDYKFDARESDLLSFLKIQGLALEDTVKQMLQFVAVRQNPNAFTLFEFLCFMARFGPEKGILDKIHQLLRCSRGNDMWFTPGEDTFDERKRFSGSYSRTFANCFVLKGPDQMRVHLYNLPEADVKLEYLIDEQGTTFLGWHHAFQSLQPTC
jgi:hypothetical protein